MNDAPERIWLEVHDQQDARSQQLYADVYKRPLPGDQCYIRADILRELVEAASELRCLVRRDVIETPLFDAAIARAEDALNT